MISAKQLSINDFKPLAFEDKTFFDEHYKKHPPLHSDNMFTTMISWREYAHYHCAFIDGNLIIMTKARNRVQFRSPIGKYDKNIFQQLLQLAKKEGSEYPLGFIDVQTKNWLEKNYPRLNIVPDRDSFDYVYLASALAELPGTPYSKIRNRLNKFKKNYEYEVEPISEDNIGEVHEFLKRWCLWKDCESDPLLENEKKAILYSMAHYFELELSGIAMYLDEKIEALSVFEPMNNDTAVVHYEKGSPDYDGIYKAINQETAKILQKEYKFIDRESDMGLPGLRQAKMSYRPDHMMEVFYINKEDMKL